MNFSKRLVIHPEDSKDLAYWTKKWGVNTKQINLAIVEEGSTNLKDIVKHLKKKGEINMFYFLMYTLFKQ